MNIKKKISFFALFLISSFFIVGEVKAACGDKNGDVCVKLAGGSYEFYNTYQTAEANASAYTSSGDAFRVTLVDQNGNIYKYNGKTTKI